MLGFHHNNPNQPFVLGSLFNGQTGTGGGEENHLKSIFMRGGSTITFNELEKSILIKDPSGNTWFMDGAGNISVTAPNDITMTAGANITMTAGQNITTSATLNISESAGVNKSTTVGALHSMFVGGDNLTNVIGKMDILVNGDYNSHTDKERKEIATKGIAIHSLEENINVKTSKELNQHSGEKTKSN
jgi:hypothetical protein